MRNLINVRTQLAVKNLVGMTICANISEYTGISLPLAMGIERMITTSPDYNDCSICFTLRPTDPILIFRRCRPLELIQWMIVRPGMSTLLSSGRTAGGTEFESHDFSFLWFLWLFLRSLFSFFSSDTLCYPVGYGHCLLWRFCVSHFNRLLSPILISSNIWYHLPFLYCQLFCSTISASVTTLVRSTPVISYPSSFSSPLLYSASLRHFFSCVSPENQLLTSSLLQYISVL